MMSSSAYNFSRTESGEIVFELNHAVSRGPSECSVDYMQSFQEDTNRSQCCCPHLLSSGADYDFAGNVDERSFSWMFDWILPISDLEFSEEQATERASRFLENIRKIRTKMHELQMKMPAWTLWDNLIKCYLRRKKASTFKSPQSAIRFIASNSFHLLASLYRDLWLAECGNTSIRGKDVKCWFKTLYPDGNIYGPVGERPIHICLLRARHFFAKDQLIYDGMIEGAKDFIQWSHQLGISKEIDIGFGKDYCAAVGNYILNAQSHEFRAGRSPLYPPLWDREVRPPPFWSLLTLWTAKHTEFKPHAMAPSDGVRQRLAAEANYDSHLAVTTGLYEGEAVLFFMIAAKDVPMVQWLLENGASPSKALRGLFFRPRSRHWIAGRGDMEWAQFWTTSQYNTNSYSGSPAAYFGLNPLSFAASQGGQQESVEIMELVVSKLERSLCLDETLIAKEQVLAQKWLFDQSGSRSESESCIAAVSRKAVLNQWDEFGNSLLHLAALNGSKKIFRWLVENGADPNAVNNDGLSPLSLTVVFGHWDMFDFIRQECHSKLMWQSGYLRCEQRDYSHIDTTGNLQEKMMHELLVRRLGAVLRSIIIIAGKKQSLVDENARVVDKNLKNLKGSDLVQYYLRKFKRQELSETVSRRASFDPCHAKEPQFQAVQGPFVSVIEAIMLCRPEGWVEATKECFPDIVLRKWYKFYWMIHLGSSCIPYVVLCVLYGVMWSRRELNLLENSGLTGFMAPFVDGVEAECGWPAIRDSTSGRIQAVLAVYGALTLIRVSFFHRHLRVTSLYPKGSSSNAHWRGNYSDFVYQNMESLMCMVVSTMFIAPGAARVLSDIDCHRFYLDVEKNTLAIAGLFLGCNVLNLMRPLKVSGTLLSTIYQMLVTDLFNFVVLYMSTFVGFLVAIQTINKAENHFLGSLVLLALNTTTARRKIGSGASSLDPVNCETRIMSMSDTAFKLLTVSLGDGFTDILQASRSTQDTTCGGFQPDGLYVILYFGWIVITNILQLNLFIAMLSRTFDTNVQKSDRIWRLDICSRVFRYEKQYPDLIDRARGPTSHKPVLSRGFLLDLVVKVGIIVYCVPEIRWFVRAVKWLVKRLKSVLSRAEMSDDCLVKDLVKSVRRDLKRNPVPPAAMHDFWSRLEDEEANLAASIYHRRDRHAKAFSIRPRILANAISRLDHHAHTSSRLVVGQVPDLDEDGEPGPGPSRLEQKVDRMLAVLERLEAQTQACDDVHGRA